MRGEGQAKSTNSHSRGLTADDWRRAAVVPVWVGSLFVAANAIWFYLTRNLLGMDAHAYWLTANREHLYGAAPQSLDAFLYSPAFAQLIWPLAHLPWPLFVTLWIVMESATFAWLLRPLGWRWGVPAFCWCVTEVAVGNVYAFLAAVAVLGMRWPALWAFPILTKVTPGLGPVWFAVRREWRQLAWAVSATVSVVGLSLSVKPTLWSEWAAFLLSSSGGGGLWLALRLMAALTLTIVGARLDKAWLLAVAMLLGCPVIGGVSALTLLTAIPRLRLRQAQVPHPRPDSVHPAVARLLRAGRVTTPT